MKFALKDPMLVNARVESQMGIVRELSSVLDFNSPYCIILRQDAIDMGYPEADMKPSGMERAHPDRVFRFATMAGIQRGLTVKLRKVSIGGLVVRDVDSLVLELEHPRFITFEFVLGRSFLKNFKMTVDIDKGYLSLLVCKVE